MSDYEQLLRPHIAGLKPYRSARDEHPAAGSTFLDANENPFGRDNRYPDPRQEALRARLGGHYQMPPQQVLLGNGSDEIIDLLLKALCTPGRDAVLTFGPTYGMYQVAAAVHGALWRELPLNEAFDLDEATVARALRLPEAKVLFLCSPNNPTGNTLSERWINHLLAHFPGVVVIDEAYADFSTQPSWRRAVARHPRLVVMGTLSKAWGLAGARVGWAFGQMWLIRALEKIKPPYNVSGPNQSRALARLAEPDQLVEEVELLRRERKKLAAALPSMPGVEAVFPSEANFLLVRVRDAPGLYQALSEQGLLVRLRHPAVPHTLRISIGTPTENQRLCQLWPAAAALLDRRS